MDTNKKIDQWAIVELFGHTRIAGKVSEQTIGGCAFVRVDVPEIGKEQPVTKLFGQGAIYAITFVDEGAAMLAAAAIRERPFNEWSIRDAIKALPPADAEDGGEYPGEAPEL